jgi:hypothetical protein
VRCNWFPFCLTVLLGCSDPEIRSQPAGAPVHGETATGSLTPSSDAAAEGEQPTVMFRCEEGTMGAYVVTGFLDSLTGQEQMVRITLDSAPDC